VVKVFDTFEAIELAFEAISKIETVEKLAKAPVSSNANFLGSWKIITEVEIGGLSTEISLYVCFPEDFPFVIPQIYLSEEDFQKYGFFPHLDTNRFICTYRDDTTILDFNRPDVIVFDCIASAKKIVTSGFNGTNLDDFSDEFIAYWDQTYFGEKSPTSDCLNFINRKLVAPALVKFCKLIRPLGKYLYCLCFDENELGFINNNLKTSGNKAIVINDAVLFPYFPSSLEKPPYKLTFSKTLEIVEEMGGDNLTLFLSYLRKSADVKVILFCKEIKESCYIVGWKYPINMNENIRGYRTRRCRPIDHLKTHHKDKVVERISVDNFSTERMMRRTVGKEVNLSYSFTIAGMGSLGSNLVPFLSSYYPKEIRIIDKEILTIANTYRHLLGLSHTGLLKVDAVKSFLIQKNPNQIVKTSPDSVLNLLKNSPEFINESDYFFVTIGNSTIDQVIGLAIEDAIITIPTFIVWVEPFLVGGHCLFFAKGTKSTYRSLLSGNYFKKNVINQKEYLAQNTELLLSESGCQSTYVPYGSKQIMKFLSSVFMKIDEIISEKESKSRGFTWIGDASILRQKGIELSEFAEQNLLPGSLIEYEI